MQPADHTTAAYSAIGVSARALVTGWLAAAKGGATARVASSGQVAGRRALLRLVAALEVSVVVLIGLITVGCGPPS